MKQNVKQLETRNKTGRKKGSTLISKCLEETTPAERMTYTYVYVKASRKGHGEGQRGSQSHQSYHWCPTFPTLHPQGQAQKLLLGSSQPLLVP